MATTIPYAQFIGSNDPFPVLESTAERIAALADQLTPEQIAAAPEPGKWSIYQIVGHLADSELMANARIRLMLFEDTPLLVAYDQDRWSNGWMREAEPFEEVLERLAILRRSTLRMFRNTPEHDLRRTGNHTERGVQTPGDYIILLAGHDINHLSQIEGIRARFMASA
jgi:hypothetical protein